MTAENRFASFLTEKGLYESIDITRDSLDELIALVAGEVKLNIHCKECGEKRVFSMAALTYPMLDGQGSVWNIRLADRIRNQQHSYAMENNPNPGERSRNSIWSWADKQTINSVRVMALPFTVEGERIALLLSSVPYT